MSPPPLHRTVRIWHLYIVVSCWVLSCHTCLGGGEVYLAPNGNDEAPGTLQAPFRTLEHAAKTAGDGGMVWMRGGVYTEPQSVKSKFPRDHPLQIRAYKEERPIIRNAKELPANFVADAGCYSIDMAEAPLNLLVDIGSNLMVQTGFQSCPDRAQVAITNPSICWDKQNLKLYVNLDRKGDDPNAHKLIASFLPTGLTFVGAKNVVLEGITVEGAVNIAFNVTESSGIVLRRCKALDSGIALRVDNATNVTIENSVFARAWNAIMISSSVNVTVTHSTIAFTRAHGVTIGENCDGLKLMSNVINAGGPSGGIDYFIAPTVNSTFDFNLLHTRCEGKAPFVVQDSTGVKNDFAAYQKATGYEQNSICAEPKFVSVVAGNENFTLTADSPGVGKTQDGKNCGILAP